MPTPVTVVAALVIAIGVSTFTALTALAAPVAGGLSGQTAHAAPSFPPAASPQ